MKQLCLSILICLTTSLFAQTPTVVLTQVANITTSPANKITCITHCGDARLFFTEAPGRIKFFDPYAVGGVTTATTFLNIVSRVKSTGNEQGLLGLAFAPDYATSGRFYVNYTNQTGTGNTTVSRFTVSSDPNAGDAASEEILFTVTQPYSNHNGGNIAFGPDGYLYIGMGDGGSAGDPSGNGQNGATRLGKMLRIDVSGATGYSIPPSNPFLSPGDNILDEIWAIGVRNPWRYSFDRLTGDLWIGDVGQDTYEEVDFIQAPDTGGQNYGWKCREGLHAFSSCTVPNRTDPVFEYQHGATNGCSITGGFVDRGNLYASLYGRYFVTDYCSGRIWSLIPNGSGLASSTDHGVYVTNSFTTFGEDAYGEVYLAQQTGKINRLTTPDGSPMALINANGDLAICQGETRTLKTGFNPQLTYQWYKDDLAIAGATSFQYDATESGIYKVEVTRTGVPTSTSDSLTLVVYDVPVLTASADDSSICADSFAPIALTGTPAGGNFTGTGVTEGSFDPTSVPSGTYVVTYNYTTSDGCVANPVDLDITINPLPSTSIAVSSASFCIDSAIETPQVSPEGGLLSGTGVSGNTFDPALAGIGQHVITYTYTDVNSCSALASVTLTVESCLSINDLITPGIQVLPNPFHEKTMLRVNQSSSSWKSFEVFTVTGKKCFSKALKPSSEIQNIDIDLSSQPAGIYFLRLNGTTDQQVIKLVHQ